jgi:SNF2 family DNA or RNA helicase
MSMLSLRPYQEEAADFLYANDRAMMLAPVGAGKTATTLTAMADMLTVGHARRFLVLAPKRVAEHVWPVEAAKWAPGLEVVVAVGSPAARAKALASGAPVVVTNYDNLQWLAEQTLDFDAVVFDELTRLKNPSGKRFKAFVKVIDPIKIRWGLTGSFTSNGLEDVFGQCKIIDQTMLGRAKGAFLQQYFHCLNREYNQWTPLPGSLERVMARIKPWTYVLEPVEYKDTLPPLHTVEVPLTMPMQVYNDMKRHYMIETRDTVISAATAAAVTTKLQQIAAGFAYSNYGDTLNISTHKLDALENIFDENQKAPTLVWYQFKAQLAALKARFPRCEELVNSDTIDRWNACLIPMLAVHPASAGHGLNLQGQSRMVWLSLPWSLELYEQAIGRLHRSGQRHDVWNYVLLTQKTVDETIFTALQNKRSVSDIAMECLK